MITSFKICQKAKMGFFNPKCGIFKKNPTIAL